MLGALGNEGFLLIGEAAEDVIDLLTGEEVVADAEAEAGILLRAEDLRDMFQSVVTAVAAAGFHAQLSEGQADVIDADEEVLQLDLLLLHPIAHGIAAEVHEGAGFEEYELTALDADARDEAVAAVLPYGLLALVFVDGSSKGVDHTETDVVACAFVFGSDITKTDDKEFFHRNKNRPGPTPRTSPERTLSSFFLAPCKGGSRMLGRGGPTPHPPCKGGSRMLGKEFFKEGEH